MMELLKKERALKGVYLVGQFSAVDKRTIKGRSKRNYKPVKQLTMN